MTIKINQDKTLKKKKTIKKTSKKKLSGNITRHTTMTISNQKINIVRVHKKKSIKKIVRKIIMLMFVVCLAFSSVYAYNHLKTYLCSLERFFIDDIEIIGCQNVTESEIKQLIPFQTGESSFSFNPWKIEKELKKYKSELKDVSICRINFGKKIVVSLTERLPEVFININDMRFGLDFDNKPFNLRGNMTDMHIPTIVFCNDLERQNLLSFYKRIKGYMLNLIPNITEIKYGEVEDIVLILNNKTSIYWGLPKENKLEEKSIKLQKILEDLATKNREIDYIDLSFIDDNKNKVIVGFFDDKENNV